MSTVKKIIETSVSSCSTALVKGLSLQIIDEMRLLTHDAKNVPIPHHILDSIDDLDVSGNDATVNFFLQTKAKEALRRAIKRRGITLHLNSCYRTVVQQHILFSWQGTGCVSIAAQPGLSNHEDGFAIDTVDFAAWKPALEAEGWNHFGPGDEVHFTYAGGGVRDDIGDLGILAFQKLWNKHNPDDQISEDGSYGSNTAARLDRSPASGFGSISPTTGFGSTRIIKLTDPFMQGDDVRKVQQALISLDLLKQDQLDGLYSSNTKLVVEIFQKREGLSVDGQVGPATRKALKITA
jgi:Putative peptidoglycan binding domain/D-alanyl-D-alanine carboxypeptidase